MAMRLVIVTIEIKNNTAQSAPSLHVSPSVYSM